MKNNIMSYKITYDNLSGLTNQIFSVVTSIIIGILKPNKIIILDKFLDEIYSDKYSNISDIINLDILNEYLFSKYNLIVVDKYNYKLEIISIKYGKNKFIDIPISIFNNNILNAIDLNKQYGDPEWGIQKNIIIQYKINNYIYEDIYTEEHVRTKCINYDFRNYDSKYVFGWINAINKELFDIILQKIEFNNKFDITDDFQIRYKKINLIHLRLETDGLVHWSQKNNMTLEDYQSVLVDTYIKLISTYINKDDMTIILSGLTDNKIIDYLKDNKYLYYIKEYNPSIGREINAIMDLSFTKICNNIFIGNYNIKDNNGSSFSYFLYKKIKSLNKCLMINLDNINDDIGIY